MNLGDLIRRNTLWVITGDASGRIIGFVIGIVLARILVPADFGMLVTIQIFTGVVGFFAGGGMSEALVQAKELEERHYQTVFTVQLLICLGIYLGFFLIAPWFAVWFDDARYQDLLRVSAINFLIRPFASIPRARLKREMRFKEITLNRFLSMLASGASSIILALHGLGPWSLILGGLVGSLVNVALFYWATRWRPGLNLERAVVTRLGGYGVKMSLNEIIVYVRNQTQNFIISRVLGPAQLGLFNKANSLAAMPADSISGSVYKPVFRALSTVQDNLPQSTYIYYRTVTLTSLYTMPFYTLLFWVAQPFITVVYGPNWSEAGLPLQILSLTGIFRCVSKPAGAVIAAQNRLGRELRIQIETWLILVLGCLVGIRWGIVGVAWAVIPSHIYLAVRISGLAERCLNGSRVNLLRALAPALTLNAGLFLALLCVHLMLPPAFSSDEPALYVLAIASSAAVLYTLAFLYAPIPALATESLRWKKRLRRATG